ncbi:MAG TPA: tetratricopeptide repeat protein [Candidatus Limnocylindrales bacterium]|nr:tetratricopeptide repeat protein [Candidatus Limnocylindrales bacterium]
MIQDIETSDEGKNLASASREETGSVELQAGPLRKSQAASLVARASAFILLLGAIYLAARQGIAAWYFHGSQPDDLAEAMRWDPANPQYPDALANVTHFYSDTANPGRIIQLCQTAVSLSPYNAHYWADLGSAYDWAGRPSDALRAFEHAHTLFPNSSEINWRLANFYARTGRISGALPLLRSVLLAGDVDSRQVFALTSNAGADSEAVLNQMIPAQSSFLIAYLNFQATAGHSDAANAAWDYLLASHLPFEAAQALPYLDSLIQQRDLDAASAVWQELRERFPRQAAPPGPNGDVITNGEFSVPILDGGFDWRVIPVAGAAVHITRLAEPNEEGSLQIEFDGSQNLDYGNVLQLVRVQPRTRYQFSADLRTRDITTDSGPRFQVYDISDMAGLFYAAPNHTGTSSWSQDTLSFETGASTRLLVVRIARPASSKFDNKIAGILWVRRVVLVPVAGGGKH